VLLGVADEGPGIAPEDAAHVFDRFYRVDESRSRAKGGAGLGLSIVASIIEAHGGRVELQTAPDAGANFTITLPSAEPTATDHASVAVEAASIA
jgi:two-component system OmpR family sensor kinase